MLVEVRTYRIKPGLRERFLEFFAAHAVPLQQSLGIQVLGPFVDVDDPDRFVWCRAFPSAEARERMKQALYEGDRWKTGLEAIAMSMLDEYETMLATAPAWFVNDLAGERAR